MVKSTLKQSRILPVVYFRHQIQSTYIVGCLATSHGVGGKLADHAHIIPCIEAAQKWFENPTFIGLTRVSRGNTISNEVSVLVHISHYVRSSLTKDTKNAESNFLELIVQLKTKLIFNTTHHQHPPLPGSQKRDVKRNFWRDI